MANFNLKQGLPYKVKDICTRSESCLLAVLCRLTEITGVPTATFHSVLLIVLKEYTHWWVLSIIEIIIIIIVIIIVHTRTGECRQCYQSYHNYVEHSNIITEYWNTVITICIIFTTSSIINITTYSIYISKVNFQLHDSKSLSVVHSIQNFVFPPDGLHRSATFLSRKTSSSRPRISKGRITSTAVLPFSGKTIQCKNFMTFAVTFHRFF